MRPLSKENVAIATIVTTQPHLETKLTNKVVFLS